MDEMKNTPTPALPRKRGYYSRALTGQMLIDYEEANASPINLEDEINIFKAHIMQWLREGVQYINIKLFIAAVNCYKGLVKTQKMYFKTDEKDKYEDCLENVFRKIGLASGLPLETLMMDPFKKQA